MSARACKTGCRTNDDCHAAYLCSGGACVAETCLQAGGAAGGCDYGQFCCGESGGPASCAGADAGACYDAPEQTWCGKCSKDADCRTASYPSQPDPTRPNVCFGPDNGKVCWLGCDPSGPSSQCPRSWNCQPILVGCKQDSDCGSQTGALCDNSDGGDGTCTCHSDGECRNDSAVVSYCKSGKCTVTTACRPSCN